MSDEDAIVPDDTGKKNRVAPAQEVFSPEQVSATQTRSPEFGDSVLYVHGDRILSATIQVAFTDGRNHLRVSDPEHQLGQFDVQNVAQDAGKAIGTFHYAWGSI
jgi:hypothetical protein